MNNIVNEIAMTIFPELQNPIDPLKPTFQKIRLKSERLNLYLIYLEKKWVIGLIKDNS